MRCDYCVAGESVAAGLWRADCGRGLWRGTVWRGDCGGGMWRWGRDRGLFGVETVAGGLWRGDYDRGLGDCGVVTEAWILCGAQRRLSDRCGWRSIVIKRTMVNGRCAGRWWRHGRRS